MTDKQSPSGWPSPRLRFSLGGLLICIFGIAAGMAEARHDRSSWTDGLFAVVAAWGAIGLAQQARQLWRQFHGDKSLTENQRWGFRFAVFWRAGVVSLMIGGFILSQMEWEGFVVLTERPNDYHSTGQLLRSAIFFLLLLFMMGHASPPRLAQSAPRRWIELAALAAGSVLALLLCWDDMTICFLVHVACEGIASTTPVRFLEPRALPRGTGLSSGDPSRRLSCLR